MFESQTVISNSGHPFEQPLGGASSSMQPAAKPSVVRIVIVEDQPLTRVGIKMSLSDVPNFEVVGEACSGIEGVSEVLRLAPDIVLMDIALPGMDGIEATAKLKKVTPNTRVIFFSSHSSFDVILMALKSGADGFVSKDRSLEEITAAINTVSQGNFWLDPAIADSVLRACKDSSSPKSLTKIESQLLTSLRDGQNLSDIARDLRTSEDAVTALMKGIFQLFAGTPNTSADLNVQISTSNPPEVGQFFERKYSLQGILGKGGAGCVFRAHHIYMDRPVAIKMLHRSLLKDTDAVRSFSQEAITVAGLDHVNVIRVYDFGIADSGDPYLVMELFEGSTLRQLLQAQKQLTPHQFFDIFIPICDALRTAHNMGIVHCDLKPSNILVRDDGSGFFTSKLTDFGLARSIVAQKSFESESTEMVVEGTPPYMSPEQCAGQPIDRHSDIYALGCVMVEALTGSPPFVGATPMELFAHHLHTDALALSQINPSVPFPKELEECIALMLKKDAAERVQSIDLVHELLIQLGSAYSQRARH